MIVHFPPQALLVVIIVVALLEFWQRRGHSVGRRVSSKLCRLRTGHGAALICRPIRFIHSLLGAMPDYQSRVQATYVGW